MPEIDRDGFNELWLLEIAHDAGVALWMTALSKQGLIDQWNRPPHSMEPREVVNRIGRLWIDGQIELHRWREEGNEVLHARDLSGRDAGRLVQDEVLRVNRRADRNRFDDWYYALTAAGGARWAEFTNPDWQRFVNCWAHPDDCDENEVCVETTTPYCMFEALLLSEYHSPETRTPLRFEVLEPFQATYWKTLPRGYRMYCSRASNENECWQKLTAPMPHEVKSEIRQHLYQHFNRWYTPLREFTQTQ